MSPSETPTSPQTHEFRAEVSALLRLVTNALYTNSEIFLRELISNASDALDKARYSALVDPSLRDIDLEPGIEIIADSQRGVLTVEDTGIGMTRDEAAENLGTIAHSGTLKFLEAAREANKGDVNLIGQFGVGFYSAFMVASTVTVDTLSARAGAEAATWSSTGEGAYSLSPGQRERRGTCIELKLKADAQEFLQRYKLTEVVRKYSNYVTHPIRLTVIDAEGETAVDREQINAARPLWAKPAAEVTDAEYEEFYRHVMGGFLLPGDAPLLRIHASGEAPVQFNAVLFAPNRAPLDLFAEDRRALSLYAKRVLIIDSTDKLLPRWLRFFRGVVDSEDLPLNVSREMLQEHRTLSAIRRTLTRRALKALAESASERPDEYASLWREFGAVIKEGLHDEASHREELLELVRYATVKHEAPISLRAYVDAMPADQPAIYFVAGEDAAALRKGPHVEGLQKRGWDVLVMTDPIDEWVVASMGEYGGKPLRNLSQGDLDAGGDAATSTDSDAIAALVERARAVLGDRVKDVRASKRLASSASCLIDPEGVLSRNMEKILRMARQETAARTSARILELNPEHDFVLRANRLATVEPDAERLTTWIELLYDMAGLAEGSVADPAGVVRRIQSVLDQVSG